MNAETTKGRSSHLENRTVPIRTDGRNLLTGLIFCKSCGCRLCYQHNVLRRKLADGTPRVYERHQFRCYRKISSRHSCNGPSSYEADLKVVNAMLLKHRKKLEATQWEMEETRNRVEQEDQNKKATKAQVDKLRTWGEIYNSN